MRFVIQRVKHSSVTIDEEVIGKINKGYMVLIGIGQDDNEVIADKMVKKMINLRIFEDAASKMNRSIIDAGGEILLVSQFTLYGDARHGKRPSFIRAARPEKAIPLYEKAIAKLGEKVHVETGIFGAEMKVQLINDGPVTILLDSERTF